jgi:hypothetical protein
LIGLAHKAYPFYWPGANGYEMCCINCDVDLDFTGDPPPVWRCPNCDHMAPVFKQPKAKWGDHE